jgi:hypothetical protein
MTVIAKVNNRVVEIVRTAGNVPFSNRFGWVMICMDFHQPERMKSQFKWVPADTRFEWVREFCFE